MIIKFQFNRNYCELHFKTNVVENNIEIVNPILYFGHSSSLNLGYCVFDKNYETIQICDPVTIPEWGFEHNISRNKFLEKVKINTENRIILKTKL